MLNAYYLFFIPLLLCTFNLSANVILPAFVGVYILLIFLFIPIVFIEARKMSRYLKKESAWKLLWMNIVSNGISTIVGIPIAYLGIIAILMLPYNLFIKLLPATVFTSRYIVSEIISIGLLIPVGYYLSVVIEKAVITKFLHNKYDEETITLAARSANYASYKFLSVIYIILVIISVADILQRSYTHW